jgi:hypothetical protein
MVPIVMYVGDNIIKRSMSIDYENHPRFFFLKMKIRILMRLELR